MLFITTVSGDKHKQLAIEMRASFEQHNWPPLIIVCAEDYPEYDTLWGGRGLKTQFAKFIPNDYTGPVAFIDADCLAVGPYPGDPPVPKNGIGGIVMWTGKEAVTNLNVNYLISTLLVFPDVHSAKRVSEKWYQVLSEQDQAKTDEFALREATKLLPAVVTGWYKQPLTNLKHLATTHSWNTKLQPS